MYNNKSAFSLVEIIIAIAIMILLAVISLNSSSKYSENRDNSKVISDIATINNALEAYSTENWDLPMPKGNNNFFKADASYAHSYENSETYGVHGFVTNKTLPKKYMNFLPLDPRTNAFYAYWKTKSNLNELVKNQYEIASVVLKNHEAKAKVVGNYTAEIWPYNLIREYNWANFVYDGSIVNFPYNPEELLLTAKIGNYDWVVTINWDVNLEKILVQWDVITVAQNAYAEIYFSDGTVSTLWDTTKESKLTLSRLVFKEEDNLLTDIKLALSAGSIWSKATSLDDDSEFEIYTTDTSAAVRWTIFGVEKDVNSSNITVVVWKVEVHEVVGVTDIEDLSDTLEVLNNDEDIEVREISAVNDVIVDNFIEVVEWDSAKWISIIKTIWGNGTIDYPAHVETSTGSLNNISEDIKEVALWELGLITDGIAPVVKSFENRDSDLKIEIWLTKIFKKADFIQVEYINTNGSHEVLRKNNDWQDNDVLVLINDTVFNNNTTLGSIEADKIEVAFWNNLSDGGVRLSKYKVINIGDEISYENKDVNDDTEILPTSIAESECKTFKVDWECVSSDIDWFKVVAYAPYNKAGDLNMYLSEEKKADITTDYVSDWYKKDSSNNSRKNWDDLTITSKWFDISDVVKEWTFVKNKSFVETKTWEKWIFLTNDWNSDFLKYSGLDLGNNFAIEIGVRGEDLNRWEDKTLYMLFNSSNSFQLYIKNNQLKLLWKNKLWNWLSEKYNISEYIWQTNISLEYNSWDPIIKINWITINPITGTDKNWYSTNLLEIYVWSNSGKSNQWNWIIDYVKVYKN